MVYRSLFVLCFFLAGCNRTPSQPELPPLKRAYQLVAAEENAAAIDVVETLLEARPGNVEAILLKAKIHELTGDRVLAHEAYATAFRLRPNDAEIRATLKRFQPPPDLKQTLATKLYADATDSFEHSELANVDEDEKAYRQTEVQPKGSSEPSPLQANEGNAYKLMNHLIARGQKQDSARARASEFPRYQEDGYYVAEPLEIQPVAITRFDRGLGYPAELSVPNIPRTTGHRQRPAGSEVRRRRRLLVGQCIPAPSAPIAPRGLVGFPVGNSLFDPIAPPSRNNQICNDDRDNNGNGLVDRDDPMCWADGINPDTYSPDLDEGSAFFSDAQLITPAPAPPVGPAIASPLLPASPIQNVLPVTPIGVLPVAPITGVPETGN